MYVQSLIYSHKILNYERLMYCEYFFIIDLVIVSFLMFNIKHYFPTEAQGGRGNKGTVSAYNQTLFRSYGTDSVPGAPAVIQNIQASTPKDGYIGGETGSRQHMQALTPRSGQYMGAPMGMQNIQASPRNGQFMGAAKDMQHIQAPAPRNGQTWGEPVAVQNMQASTPRNRQTAREPYTSTSRVQSQPSSPNVIQRQPRPKTSRQQNIRPQYDNMWPQNTEKVFGQPGQTLSVPSLNTNHQGDLSGRSRRASIHPDLGFVHEIPARIGETNLG